MSGLSTSSRTLRILKIVASSRRSISVSDIVSLTSYERNAVRRSLEALESEGFVNRSPTSNKYLLNQAVLLLGRHLLSVDDKQKLISEFISKMSEETGETCTFASIQKDCLLATDVARGAKPFPYNICIGDRVPIHCSAVGRAILSQNPAAEGSLHRYSIKRMTERTVVEVDAFINELRQADDRGYAIDDREWLNDLTCVGSFIVDEDGKTRSGIGICGPSTRFSTEYSNEIALYLADQCREISRRIHANAA